MYKKYQDIGKLYPLICKNKTLNIMKISILLLLFGIFSVSATGYSQEARVSITQQSTKYSLKSKLRQTIRSGLT